MTGIADLLAGGIVKEVGQIANDLITTEKERRELDQEDRRIDNTLLVGQIETNKVEAASASRFVAGWRPAIGWVCAAALGIYYIPKALAMTALWVWQAAVLIYAWHGQGAMPALPPYPDFGLADLLGLTLNLLGMAGLRHREVMSGRARNNMSEAPANETQREAP